MAPLLDVADAVGDFGGFCPRFKCTEASLAALLAGSALGAVVAVWSQLSD